MIKQVIEEYKRRKNPIKYWKKRGVKIGQGTKIAPSASFSSEPYLVEIGDNCNITHKVEFIPHDGACHVLRNLYSELCDVDIFKGKIIVGNNVFIGNHSAILSGVKIGDNSIIGYGSIVTKDVPDNVVVCGVPAKVLCTIEEFKSKNSKYFVQTKNMSYQEKKDFLIKTIEKNNCF